MLRIPFELFDVTLQCFEPFRMHRIWIRKLRIGIQMLGMRFEWLEFGFECFEYRLTGFNLYSNALNLIRVVRIGIRML